MAKVLWAGEIKGVQGTNKNMKAKFVLISEPLQLLQLKIQIQYTVWSELLLCTRLEERRM